MAKTFALIFGAVFVLVGLLGYVGSPIVGATGFFVTDGLHNFVHLAIGVVLLIVALKAPAASAKWLKIFGVIYLVLFLLGLVTIPEGGELLGLVAMNTNDHFLHLGLGVVLLLVGFVAGKKGPAAPATM